MPNSLPPVVVPAKTVVNLYAETSIAVGTRLIIQNLSSTSECMLTEQDSEPTTFDGLGKNIIKPKEWVQSASTSPVGAYAYSDSTVYLQVEAVE